MLMTRCCSCSDEIVAGSQVWKGEDHDETACSMLCRYRSLIESTWGYSMSAEATKKGAMTRIEAAREALLHDPEIFGEDVFNVIVMTESSDYRGVIGSETASANMIVLGADESVARFEIVGSDDEKYDGDEVWIGWDVLVDMVPRP